MIENHGAARYSVLTEVELASLDRRGLRRQAKTIQKLADFAVTAGLSSEVVEQVADRIRSASPREVKAYKNALNTTLDLFGNANLTVTEPTLGPEDTIVELEVTSFTSNEQYPLIEVDDSEVSEGSENPFLTNADLDEIRSFYRAINKKSKTDHLDVPNTDTDIDLDEVQALLELYARNSKRPKLVKSMIDKAVKSLEVGSKAAAKEYNLSAQSIHSLRFEISKKIAELLDGELGEPTETDPQTSENSQELISNVVHGDFENQPTSIRRVEIENGKARLV